jgi:hypothetical protein
VNANIIPSALMFRNLLRASVMSAESFAILAWKAARLCVAVWFVLIT